MKPKLAEFFPTKAIDFQAAYQYGRAAGRPDQIGAPREAAVRDYLSSILPTSAGLTKGHVIYKRVEGDEVKLDISLEFDLILFDASKATVFPWDKDGHIKAIPFEFIYGIIEVKSDITDAQVKNIAEKTLNLMIS